MKSAIFSLVLVLELTLVGCAGAAPTPPERAAVAPTMAPVAVAMAPFASNGFELRGGEYWPYVGVAEPRYPEDVLWGFYPKKGETPPGETDPNADAASPAAVACAERAFAELHRFLDHRPADFDRVVHEGTEHGVTRLFYLWVNDYTRAADPFPPGVRTARLWYWKRKVPDPQRPAGYWKWESTLTQRGECLTPSFDEAAKYLREKHDEILAPR